MQNGPITLTPLYDTPLPASAWVEKDVALTMRDGTHMAVDVYRPDESGTAIHAYAERMGHARLPAGLTRRDEDSSCAFATQHVYSW